MKNWQPFDWRAQQSWGEVKSKHRSGVYVHMGRNRGWWRVWERIGGVWDRAWVERELSFLETVLFWRLFFFGDCSFLKTPLF